MPGFDHYSAVLNNNTPLDLIWKCFRVENMCDEVCQKSDIPDENLYGRCGYLSALLFIRSHLGPEAIQSNSIIKVRVKKR